MADLRDILSRQSGVISRRQVEAAGETAAELRISTAQRMDAALVRQPRLPRRRWLGEVLADLASGTHSVLEREYLVRVERAHGLPAACASSGR